METATPKRTVMSEDASKLGIVIAPDDEAEALLRSTLDALSAHVAVLDETGTIVAVNQAWRAFADATGYVGKDHGVGTNYLAVCESGAEQSRDAARTARALREIIAGTRWFQLRVTYPGAAQVRRIVIAHEDITDVKLAEEPPLISMPRKRSRPANATSWASPETNPDR
jgi:two-component system NarL family sensor kinase